MQELVSVLYLSGLHVYEFWDDLLVHKVCCGEASVCENIHQHVSSQWMFTEQGIMCFELRMAC